MFSINEIYNEMTNVTDPIERLARDLDWNLLRTFIVIAKSKSLTEAAEVLRLKQPTLSSALKRLEDRIGKKLVVRSPGTFRLTTAGKVLEREAIEIHGAILRLGSLIVDYTF
jgi:DNA-binding transcriptional LysR family regulator